MKNKDRVYKMSASFPMTITQELFDSWQLLRKSGDPEKLQVYVAKKKVSRPVIDRALNYGHCPNTKYVDKISKFFADRKQKENETSTTLIELATT